jgi:hypothetical protein
VGETRVVAIEEPADDVRLLADEFRWRIARAPPEAGCLHGAAGLSRFSTFYATDQGLTFAGMAIVILPPLLLFLVLQRSLIQGLTAGAVRR